MSRTFNESELRKLKEIISEGVQITEETETLKDGLKDTVAAIAEELDIKPAVINKAIRTAYKADFTKKQEEFEDLEEILRATGRNY
mgnify:CR=1 FL=1